MHSTRLHLLLLFSKEDYSPASRLHVDPSFISYCNHARRAPGALSPYLPHPPVPVHRPPNGPVTNFFFFASLDKPLIQHCTGCESMSWSYKNYSIQVGLHEGEWQVSRDTSYVCKAFAFDNSKTHHIIEYVRLSHLFSRSFPPPRLVTLTTLSRVFLRLCASPHEKNAASSQNQLENL